LKTLFLFFCSYLLLSSCTPNKDDIQSAIKDITPHELKGEVFGSYFIVKYRGNLGVEELRQELDVFFAAFNSEFNTYQKDSVITRYNELPAKQKMKVSPRFIAMLKLSQKFYTDTQGAFDPTLSPVIKIWGFGGGKRAKAPSDSEIKKALSKVGFPLVKWDETSFEVWKEKEGITLDVNAFAPGWAADLMGELLLKKGVAHFMVDISGEILVKGERGPGSPWIMGIEKPAKNLGEGVQLAFKLSSGAIATSGNYRQFYDEEGKRFSHILDPKTGRPVSHSIASASVIAGSAAEADAWSTAMMVLGMEGMALAELKGLKSYLIDSPKAGVFEPVISPSMKNFLEKNSL
jgi:FAD:protein FMN transferase